MKQYKIIIILTIIFTIFTIGVIAQKQVYKRQTASYSKKEIQPDKNKISVNDSSKGEKLATQSPLNYSDVISEKSFTKEIDSRGVPFANNFIHKGKVVEWKGKISNYSPIDGVKFCIIDDKHKSNILENCDWFWAFPKEIATENDPDMKEDWSGSWFEFVFQNYSDINYNEINSKEDIFLITGILDDVDLVADGLDRPIPNIELIKIEKL